ncbi:hypothetical protein DAI22_09g098350 [Oryza sativa Japonica Group]|nr:hypothetical protein DAI22_09g098350 [Oryza sativa Japonica Group]
MDASLDVQEGRVFWPLPCNSLCQVAHHPNAGEKARPNQIQKKKRGSQSCERRKSENIAIIKHKYRADWNQYRLN